jgi:regulator of protease activity HflC (stomatin/prohibitin superfamily)
MISTDTRVWHIVRQFFGQLHVDRLSVLIMFFAALGCIELWEYTHNGWHLFWLMFAAWLLSTAVNVAAEWERAVVLRFGKFNRTRGPGFFFIIPLMESIPRWIDHRIRVMNLRADQTLTQDTVPVVVDTVVFWMVWDSQKAALEVARYEEAVAWASATSLRDIIGRTDLADLLKGRAQIGLELQKEIDERTEPWGITVQSVEISDVLIPQELQQAMSRQAQAEREKRARVIISEAEIEVAERYSKAADIYAGHPDSLHLRGMSMLYDGIKEKGSLIIAPSEALGSMNLGGIAGLKALKDQARPDKSDD